MHRDDMTEVMIVTDQYTMTGQIALPPGSRLTDYLDEARRFIAVTHAVVADKEGEELFRTKFLNVSREHIELMLPTAMIEKQEDNDQQASLGQQVVADENE